MDVIRQDSGENWQAYHGDCIEVIKGLPDDSIDFSIWSPPYLSMYVYSNSERDMGNCRTEKEFMDMLNFLIVEMKRVIKQGRIVSVDCMNVPAMKERDGYIGLKDFRGWIIKAFVDEGFIFHSEHCMWKDPLIEATRTKALGLMHKQLCKDSTMCRAGIPQYLLAFRKPGENKNPVPHQNGLSYFHGENPPKSGVMSHEIWRRYASPVWMDVNFTKTLNYRAARSTEDERHICPMSLDAIGRGITLWSNPGDVVLTAFGGVGSEGYKAVEMGRKAILIELKESYYNQLIKNMTAIESRPKQINLFDI